MSFDELLKRKLIDESNNWNRERQDNEVPAKQLAFCWKRYSSKTTEELMEVPQVIIGTLIHRGLEHYFGYEDKPDNVLKKPIGEYVIVGMPDLVKDDTVYEFKYSTTTPREPKPWDETQLRVYLWMTGKPKGELVYFTPRNIKVFEVDEALSDEDIIRLLRYKWAKYRWECSRCPFKHECEHRLY